MRTLGRGGSQPETHEHRGPELDAIAVQRWLRGLDLPLSGCPVVTRYTGGASNLTYRLSFRERDLVLRRRRDSASRRDLSREYQLQRALAAAYPWVPGMVSYCADLTVLGAEFYVMERIPGDVLRRRLPAGVRLTPRQARQLSLTMVDRLVSLHRLDPSALGLGALGLGAPDRGSGYPARQVELWSEAYARSRTWNVPSFRYVRDYLCERAPAALGSVVIHNDFRIDNLVVDAGDPSRVVGVLDWELASVGDPLMDLGVALAYWVQADDNLLMRAVRSQPSVLPGMLTRRELVEHYLAQTGHRPDDFTFYEVFGLFRLAGVLAHFFSRHLHRRSSSTAFRHAWVVLHALEWRCRAMIARSKRRGC